MRKFRKEGSIMVMSLFYFLFVALLAAVFIGLVLMNETYNRVQEAVEVGARTRALAVNIPLKEQYGIIETYRNSSSQGYSANYVEPRYSFTPTAAYDYPILDPASDIYRATYVSANDTAKAALIANLATTLGTNEEGESLTNIKEENICVQVLPLPAGNSITGKAKLNFTCTAKVNGVSKTISANNVVVNGYTHPLNNSDDNRQRVYNVVFVGVVYEDNNFFYNLIQSIANGSDQSQWGPRPIRAAYAIAYPQIDDCTADDC